MSKRGSIIRENQINKEQQTKAKKSCWHQTFKFDNSFPYVIPVLSPPEGSMVILGDVGCQLLILTNIWNRPFFFLD